MAVLMKVVVVVVFVPVLEVVEEAVVSAAEGSGTPGLGHVTSCASSGQNSLILLKRYHWQLAESPEGVIRSGRSVAVGDHSFFSSLYSTSGPSDVSRTNTLPLWADENRRWWKDLIPTSFLVCSYGNICQSLVGTTTLPSGVPVSCAVFTLAEVLTTLARSVSPPIFVCLYLCTKVDLYHCGIKSSLLIHLFFRRPKHQSGENLVWPATINDSVMFSWSLVRTRHSRYPTMMLFLF